MSSIGVPPSQRSALPPADQIPASRQVPTGGETASSRQAEIAGSPPDIHAGQGGVVE